MTDLVDRPTTLPTTEPVEKVTPIKPSEAIRLGCLAFPVQHFGGLAQGNRACAMGAMYAGYGDSPHSPGITSESEAGFFQLKEAHLSCPECDLKDDDIPVAHLNDDHRWSRERIADWLESIGL